MNKKFLFTAAVAFSSLLTFAGDDNKAKLIEKVEKKGTEIVIPYEKYLLPNGLIILVHEDHSDPVMHLDVTYHVGSDREQEGRSGFAHFFEHMMFQGSDNVADEEHFKIVTEAGGQMNGTTTSDRTNYFETLPANQLEVAMWLESDRMGFLLDAVTQKKFEVQRATVKNERGQNYDNRPYGLVHEKIAGALYPKAHPYSWPTIGFIEDLNRVDVNDLKKFFMRWYGPNNAVLTVAGDVNTADVVKLAEKYFGPIPRGPEVKSIPKTPVTLDKDRYISYEDNIRFPMTMYAYPTVPGRHDDEAALDVLSDILGGGKNSIFYQTFVKTQKAVQATVSNPCQELAGIFTLNVVAFPGVPLKDIHDKIKECFVEFEKRGVKDEDLSKYKANYEAQLFNSLGSVSGKASTLAADQTFAGDASYIKKDYARYMKVTKDDVMRVYNKYIKGKPAVILTVYPKGKADIVAIPDNFKTPERNINAPEAAEYKNLAYNKAKDSFDRHTKPAAGANPMVNVPALWKENFANGLKVIGTKSDEIPTVTLRLSLTAGHRFEPKEKAGIAALTADMLNESTQKHTGEQINEMMESMGSSIRIGSGDEEINITVTSLTKNLDATLKLAEEVLFAPLFSQEDFERVKKQQLEGIANRVTSPVAIADNIYNKLLYGNDHIMGIPADGTEATVKTLSVEDIKQYYNEHFSPSITSLVIVGDVSKEAILPKIDFLKNWAAKNVAKPVEAKSPVIDKSRIYLVDKEKAPQSQIRIGFMGMPYDATGEYYKSQMMNYSLGGAFNSRINLNLREDKGYTYGAHSYFSGSKFAGPYTASAGVRGNSTDSSVIEFMKEIKNFADNGMKQEELDFTRKSIGQSEALKYETPSNKAGFLKRILDYDLDPKYVGTQSDILNKMSLEEANRLAKKNLQYDKMNILVVGDKATVGEGLKKLGYEVIELDMNGNPLNVANPEVPKKEVDNKKKVKD